MGQALVLVQYGVIPAEAGIQYSRSSRTILFDKNNNIVQSSVRNLINFIKEENEKEMAMSVGSAGGFLKTILFVFCSIIVVVFIMNMGYPVRHKDFFVQAPVLSINENCTEGKSIGALLSSASGHISDDTIKVGVEVRLEDYVLLYDLKLRYSELAYYRNQKTLPLLIRYRHNAAGGVLHMFLNNREVHEDEKELPMLKFEENLWTLFLGQDFGNLIKEYMESKKYFSHA